MKAAYHMHLGDPKLKRLARRLDDFGDSQFEGVRVAFSSTKCAKLAGEKANIGVIDVPIEDVGGAVPVFALPHDVGDQAERIDVGRAIESRSFVLVDPLSGDDLIEDRAQFLRNEPDACEIFHKFNLTQDLTRIKLPANFLISEATFGVAACCRGYDESCPSNVRPFYAAR